MRKTAMLTAVTAVAAIAVTGCGSGHTVTRPRPLASVSSQASHVSSTSDRSACLLWRKSLDDLNSNAESLAGWMANMNKAADESTDSAFKHDATAAVKDATAEKFAQLAQDDRNAVNDCEADGVNIYGS